MASESIIKTLSQKFGKLRFSTTSRGSNATNVVFRQLFDTTSSTYTYILGDATTSDAVIIDPVSEQVERDSKQLKEMGLNLVYAMNTHVHADHITGTGLLKKIFPSCLSVISDISKAQSDLKVKHGDVLNIGNFSLHVRSTPGHTNGCVTYVAPAFDSAFTGDALLIRGCGRTDFQEGNPQTLYKSVHEQIFTLDDHTKLYPAHDYKGLTVTTVGEEKKYNPRLTKNVTEFVQIMNNLKLAYPKMIDKAMPSNMVCGLQ